MSSDSCCVSVGCYIENNLVVPFAIHGIVDVSEKRFLQTLCHIMCVISEVLERLS